MWCASVGTLCTYALAYVRRAYLDVIRTNDVRTDKVVKTDRVLTLLDLRTERHAVLDRTPLLLQYSLVVVQLKHMHVLHTALYQSWGILGLGRTPLCQSSEVSCAS